jgi:subtilase family serine protease
MTNHSSEFGGWLCARIFVLWLALLFSFPEAGLTAEKQMLQGHVPRAVLDLKLPAIDRLPATTTFQLAIGLPMRNRESFTNFLKELYTPGSPSFRKFLTPRQFTEKFGPTEQDYQALIEFARTNGLTVTCTFSNRALLDIKATVADIERVFHVKMRVYQHPTEARTFFAPDVEPSIDSKVPVLHISGLDSYVIPHRATQQRVNTERVENGTPTGSGPSNTYLAQDIRTAYVPGVTLNGSGQSVGLLEYNGYYSDLIQDYAVYNGIPPPSYLNVSNWGLDGFNAVPTGTGYYEVQVDIEMVLAMAPGLSSIIVYELPPPTNNIPIPPDDALNLMAVQDLCNQLSSSVEFNLSPNTDMIFQELAAQGQSFFQASGDGGGRTGSNVYSPFDDPYITLVGGTELTTTTNGSYSSEVVYNEPDPDYPYNNDFFYSGGGISPSYSMPWWQEGISMSANGGSTTMRNMPDVAMLAYDVFTFYSETGQKSGGFDGTSVAAPLWAGFMALVNEQATTEGLPVIGFANPAIYAIGKGSSYNSCFHDITSGNNENPLSPNAFTAVAGYDLCTGWGTPKGQALIDALCSTPSGLKYVKFGNSAPGNGSWSSPYNTLARGVAGVPANGAIVIKGPGSSAETMTISKPMTIQAVGGSATIGH